MAEQYKYTFTYTLGLVDDEGREYPFKTMSAWFNGEATGGPVFSVAHGIGTDTDTGESEEIMIVQGFTNDIDHAKYYCAYVARTINQRAFGWFQSQASYVPVSELVKG